MPAAGLGLHAGTMLETGLGTDAVLELFATVETLHRGTEVLGPQLMNDDSLAGSIVYRDFRVEVPQGIGNGATPDPDKTHFFRHDRGQSLKTVAGEQPDANPNCPGPCNQPGIPKEERQCLPNPVSTNSRAVSTVSFLRMPTPGYCAPVATRSPTKSCSHRGAMLCPFKRRNRKTFARPFHRWTFSSIGKLLMVKDPDGAGYRAQFNAGGSHDLTRVARFENYRGFLFGSFNADVPPLEDSLGEARKMTAMIAARSEGGLGVLRGSSTYSYDGNRKLQAENGADGHPDKSGIEDRAFRIRTDRSRADPAARFRNGPASRARGA